MCMTYRMISVFVFSICFCLFSCKKDGESSELEVARGKIIDENEYPSIVRLEATHDKQLPSGLNVTQNLNCTGSVISSNTILTAAHCSPTNYDHYVYSGNKSGGYYSKVKLVKIHPNFKPGTISVALGLSTPELVKYDVALWIFPHGTFSHYKEKLQLSDIEPKVDNKVRLVGYGCYTRLFPLDEEEAKKTGKVYDFKAICDTSKEVDKRTGTNKIHVIQEDKSSVKLYSSYETVDLIGDKELEATGEAVQATVGDSGGPLLFESQHTKIIGVASNVKNTARNSEYCESKYTQKESLWDCLYFSSNYVNPVSTYSESFLESAVDNDGAIIPGIQIGIRVLEHKGKIKVLYKEEPTSFNEKVEEHKIIDKFNGNSYSSISSLKQAWRAVNFYDRSKASWNFK